MNKSTSTKYIGIRIPYELATKIEQSQFNTTTDCIVTALNYYFDNKDIELIKPHVMSNEDVIEKKYLEQKNEELKETCDYLKNQLDLKESQLKTKDQQIFSLIAVQKDLTEKTTEQVKLLSERIGSKKWYQFWK